MLISYLALLPLRLPMLALPTIALLIAVSTAACDPEHQITFVNNTNQRIEIAIAGGVVATIEPMESGKISEIPFQTPTLIEAKDDKGETLFSETLSWDELEDMDWMIVVEPVSGQR